MLKKYSLWVASILLVSWVGYYVLAQDSIPAVPVPVESSPVIDATPTMELTQNALDTRIEGPVMARNQDLSTILRIFQSETGGVSFVLPQECNKKVTFNLENPSVRQILDSVLPANGMSYMIDKNGVVRIHLDSQAPIQIGAAVVDIANEQANEKTNENVNEEKDRTRDIRKSLSVMSSVLDYILKDRLGDDYVSRGIFSKGSQGYWIPDVGAFFVVGVKFPLNTVGTKENKGDEGGNDLWDRFEKKLDSKNSALPIDGAKKIKDPSLMLPMPGGVEFREDKVRQLREILFDALAVYGNRFEGLHDEENLIILVEGEGRPSMDVVMPDVSFQWDPDSLFKGQKDSAEITEIVTDATSEDEKDETSKPDSPMNKIVQNQLSDDWIGKSIFNSDDAERMMRELQARLGSQEQIFKTHEKDFEISKREMDVAQQKLNVMKKQFEAGLAPQRDVLDAEAKALSTQKAVNEEDRRLLEVKRELEILQNKQKYIEQQKKQLEDQQHQLQQLQTNAKIMITQANMEERQPFVMVFQVKFGDLAHGQSAKEIAEKVKVTTY